MATVYYVNNGSSYYTSSLSNGSKTLGEEVTITLTIKTPASYIFDASHVPVLTLRGNNTILATLPFTIQSERIATLTTDFTVEGETQPSSAQVTGNPRDITNAAKATLQNKVNNTASSTADGTYRMGVQRTITLTASNNYYEFDAQDPPILKYLRYGSVVGTETFTVQDAHTATLETTLNPFQEIPEDGYTLTAQIQGSCPAVKCYISANGLTNCETNYPTGYYAASLIGTEAVITVFCPSGYEFEVTPYIQKGQQITDFEQVTETLYRLTFSLIAANSYTIAASAVKQTPILTKYGFIMAYRLTRQEMLEVSNKRWVEVEYEPEKFHGATVLYSATEEYIDTAKYVVALFKLFVHLETELTHRLMFGPYDMEMTCDVISDDLITVDCGTVEIVGQYHNDIDYSHTEIEAYLPFIGLVALKTTDFMDKTINLKYQVNTLTGDAIAVMTANGLTVFSQSCSVAMKIPFQLGINENVNTELDPNNHYLTDTPPCLYVKSHPPADPEERLPYHSTKYYACFGDLTGYTEATEIDFEVLSDFITATEIEEIVSLLQGGVFL